MSFKCTSTVKVKSNRTPEILAALRRAGNSYVTVGVHDDTGVYAGRPDVTPSKVALWMEWGTENMDKRPFLAPTMSRNKATIAKLAAKGLAQCAYLKVTVAQGLGLLGAGVVTMIQNTIKSNVAPALSGQWDPPKGYLGWRRKHYPESGQRTLIASGLLLRSVRYVLHLNKYAKVEAKAAANTPVKADAAPAKAGKTKGPAKAGRDEHGRFLKKSPEQKAAARAASRADAQARKAQHQVQRTIAKQHPDETAAKFNAQTRAYTRPAPK